MSFIYNFMIPIITFDFRNENFFVVKSHCLTHVTYLDNE